MKVIVVRHGQAEHNVKDLCDADPKRKTPLTEQGISQAKAASSRLRNDDFDIIFASDFLRTQQTAEIINENHNKRMVIDSRINERRSGYDNKPVKEFHRALKESGDFWNARFNDGESFEEEKTRVLSFLDELKNKNYNSVLIVTHMETIQIISGYFHRLSNQKMWNISIDNGQILEFEL